MQTKAHNLAIVASKEKSESEPAREGKIVRFLTWIHFLRTSTMDNNTDGKQVNWGFIFIITILFGVIAVAFLTIIGIGGFIWLDFKEDWRGTEAHRENERKRYTDGLQKRCEQNVLRQKTLIKIVEQGNVKVPPEFLLVEECGTFQPTETPKK